MQPDAIGIDSVLLKELVASATANMYLHKGDVDALNVFPVPDGDTGTNMYLTFQAAFRELSNNPSTNIIELLESAAYGALMGARGNSGVIVSQFFRGFVKALPKETQVIGKKELALGISGAASMALKAVRQPVEGTILTVIREMANYATDNVNNDRTLKEYMNDIYEHANLVLSKTPEMLPVLRQAGVVDAGGQGLVYFVEGIVQHINGKAVSTEKMNEAAVSKKVVSVASYTDDELLSDTEINFQYCTEFILKGKELDLEHIKNSLSPHGDCLLVVGDENTTKIHIHTNNPGIILDFAVRLGEMFEIQIHNMVEQSQQRLAKLVSQESGGGQIGVVAISTGDGMDKIFKSLGVNIVINGGQTMNPSVEDMANAVSKLEASKVILLPNNSNIVMTANHVQDLVKKEVRVVPTQSVPEGLAAMMSFSQERTLDENVEKMTEKSSHIITGEVTYAVRSIQLGDLDINQGDIIGLVNGDIVTYGDNPEKVVEEALKKIPSAASSLVTIYFGADVSELTAQELLNRLEKVFPDAEFELYYGGQPLYYYLFSVE
ncbi:MAG TPA: DAK2 domain-containing protein [Bacillota bacterium]|nr:DAK2 domain-containing protein [Bacillota bacterium]